MVIQNDPRILKYLALSAILLGVPAAYGAFLGMQGDRLLELPDVLVTTAPQLLVVAFGLPGIVSAWYAHYLLAKAKGYSGWWSLLIVLNLLGLAILIIMPNRRQHG